MTISGGMAIPSKASAMLLFDEICSGQSSSTPVGWFTEHLSQ
jgi:hypothetical protein